MDCVAVAFKNIENPFTIAAKTAMETAGSLVCVEGDAIVRKYANGDVTVIELLPKLDSLEVEALLNKLYLTK